MIDFELQCDKCVSKEVCESKQKAFRKFCETFSDSHPDSFIRVEVFCVFFTRSLSKKRG